MSTSPGGRHSSGAVRVVPAAADRPQYVYVEAATWRGVRSALSSRTAAVGRMHIGEQHVYLVRGAVVRLLRGFAGFVLDAGSYGSELVADADFPDGSDAEVTGRLYRTARSLQ